MPLWAVCKDRALLASCDVTRSPSRVVRTVTPLVKCPMTCRKVSLSVWLTFDFSPPRWLGHSSHRGDPEPAGRHVGVVDHIAPPNADLATNLSPRVPKVTLLTLPHVRVGRKRWSRPAEHGLWGARSLLGL